MAKRYYDLYPQVWAFDNLHRAFRRAAKGKRGTPPAAAFEWALERNLIELQEQLRDFTYTPGGYRSFYTASGHNLNLLLTSSAQRKRTGSNMRTTPNPSLERRGVKTSSLGKGS